MAKNEKTSKRVAKLAGEYLSITEHFELLGQEATDALHVFYDLLERMDQMHEVAKSLAASCLTQAPDKKKRKRKRK